MSRGGEALPLCTQGQHIAPRICAPPGHAPPDLCTPAYTEEGALPPHGCVSPLRANPRERGGFRVVARSRFALAREHAGEGGGCFHTATRLRFALARELGEGGGGGGGAAVRVPVRVWLQRALPACLPLCRGEGAASVRSGSHIARAHKPRGALQPGARARVHARPVRANRGGVQRVWGAVPFSSPRTDPSCAWPLRAKRGGHRAASGIARKVPGKRGKGGGAEGQRRGTYLSRAPRSCAPPLLARKWERRLLRRGLVPCSRVLFARERRVGGAVASPLYANGGGVSLPVQPPVRESTGAAGAVFGSPVRRERGRGRKGGRTCPAPPLRAYGKGAKGGRAPRCG
ncbi:hypothetical protein EDB89DRAFT_1911524 [Lactarius sanguifluus]|nr:hypothetical protein EDB89DRAFT_1911524 [Lactarius sanguifluus]